MTDNISNLESDLLAIIENNEELLRNPQSRVEELLIDLYATINPQIVETGEFEPITVTNNRICKVTEPTGYLSGTCDISQPNQSCEIIFESSGALVEIQGLSKFIGADCNNGAFTPQNGRYDILVTHDGVNPYAIVMKL